MCVLLPTPLPLLVGCGCRSGHVDGAAVSAALTLNLAHSTTSGRKRLFYLPL